MEKREVTNRIRKLAGTKKGKNKIFAAKVGINEKLASNILNGHVPKWNVLIDISEAFKRSLDWLLTGKEFKITDGLDEKTIDLTKKAIEILTSDTDNAEILEKNIIQFHKFVQIELIDDNWRP